MSSIWQQTGSGESPASSINQQQRHLIDQALQGHASSTADSTRLSGSHQYSTALLNQLLQQQQPKHSSAIQRAEATLRQQGILSLLPTSSHAANNNVVLAAAAVQQQLMAALATPDVLNLQCSLNPFAGTGPGATGEHGAGNGGLLSRDQEALLRQIPHSSTSSATSNGTGLPRDSSGRLSQISKQKDAQLMLGGNGSTDMLTCRAVNRKDSPNTDPSATTVEAANKECSTQLPCQARGMAADHNSSTAYFDIPNSATHGQHLLCSYPACRAAGVKFRYCFFCKKPVTKQNFRSRHLHADLEKKRLEASSRGTVVPVKEDVSKTGSVSKTSNVSTSRGSKGARAKTSQLIEPDDETSKSPDVVTPVPKSQEKVIKKVEDYKSKMPSSLPPKKKKNYVCSDYNAMHAPSMKKDLEKVSSSANDVNVALSIVSRRRRWGNLLHDRPTTFKGMDAWLVEVLAVSDMSTPWDETKYPFRAGTGFAGWSAAEQSRWTALLGERPQVDDKEDAVMTAWLVKVLNFSCKENGSVESTTKAPNSDIIEEDTSEDTQATSSKRKAELGSDGDDLASKPAQDTPVGSFPMSARDLLFKGKRRKFCL